MASTPLPIDLPLPSGWFFALESRELAPGQVTTRTLFGEQVVFHRTASGVLRATDPFCPHLGAHFGQGGTVEGEELRCLFHGFRFGEGGACTHGYDGERVPRITLRSFPVEERWGLVFLWYHLDGEPPSFPLPSFSLDGCPPFRVHRQTLASHPQELAENTVDVGHFTVLHGYRAVSEREPMDVDGPLLTMHFALERQADHVGQPERFAKSEFDATLHGLGVNHIFSDVPELGSRTRILVLQTPTTPGHVEMVTALSFDLHAPATLHPLMAWIPKVVRDAVLQRATMAAFLKDTREDRMIWDHKAFLPRPGLAAGDGPIGRFRAWARQFYGHCDEQERARLGV